MKRLTEHVENIKITDRKRPETKRGLIRYLVTHNGITKQEIVEAYNEIYDRLLVYEDTGITPDQMQEIDRLCGELCRELAELKELLEKKKREPSCDNCKYCDLNAFHKGAAVLSEAKCISCPVDIEECFEN